MAGICGRASHSGYARCGAHKRMTKVHHNSTTDVSIIIVNWNTRSLLERCLSSVMAGVDGVATQVLVVDNGSRDGSAELVASGFPEVDLVRNQENAGFARANNQAFAMARGRYVLLLNPDTELRNDAVRQMVQFLDADPRRAGATAVLRNPDGTLQRYHKRLPRWRFILWSETVLRNAAPGNRRLREFYMLDEPFDVLTEVDRKSTRLNSSHVALSRMPSSA